MSFRHSITHCPVCGQSDTVDLESIEGSRAIYECYNCGSIQYSCIVDSGFECFCLYYDAVTGQLDDICIRMGLDCVNEKMPFSEIDIDSFLRQEEIANGLE